MGGADTSIVTRRQIIGAQGAGIVEQMVETDVAVAGQTGVGRDTTGITGDKVIDDLLLEDLLDVDQIKRDAKLGGDAPGIVGRLQGAAGVFPALPG